MVSSRDQACGEESKGILIRDNGRKESHMDMECILGRTATNMRVNSKTVSSMDRGCNILLMAICTKVTI